MPDWSWIGQTQQQQFGSHRAPSKCTIDVLAFQNHSELGLIGLQSIWVTNVGHTSKEVGIIPGRVLLKK